MTILIIGLVLFIMVHMVPSMRPLRAKVVSTLGDKGYQGVFSLLALGGLGLIIYGMMQAPFVNLWMPPTWGKMVMHSVMPLGIIVYCATFVPSSLTHFTRHPMLWGTFVWAGLHLLVNGDLASLLLFGGIGAFAVVKIFLIGDRQSPELRPRQPISKDLVLVTVGLVVYSLLLYFHEWLSGVAIVSW